MNRLWERVTRRATRRSSDLEQIGIRDSAEADAAEQNRKLTLRFESLGENCEIGFLQEHYGASPLGLFRWSGIALDSLVTALDSGLQGIGDPEFTRVDVNTQIGEFFISDIRYGMTTHTFMFEQKHSAEDVLKTFCARGKRLREKMLEDLQEARKIFVFQTDRPVPEAELERVHHAFRRLGPSAEMLYVRPALTEVAGSVERVKPGLLTSYIDRAGFDGASWEISYSLWLEIMSNAVHIVDTRG